MKNPRAILLSSVAMAILSALVTAAPASERVATSQPGMLLDESIAKVSGDTVQLMGPGGFFQYRGDFETASARPGAAGFLPDGWYPIDETAPANHWHVDAYNNPFSGKAAWCGDIAIRSCGEGDVAGGYLDNGRDILEFRKTVGGAAVVRVQADLQFDSEPGFDFTTLQRRTATNPDFEPTTGGQGLSWDGRGTTTVDYTFNYTAAELLDGTDIAVAFIFDADGGRSDGDCSWPTDGAARLDNITVTVNATTYTEDFEDDELGPDWVAVPNPGVGDFARVWSLMSEADDCVLNYSKLIAFIDDGLVVPGTGGTFGAPGMDYGPPGGYIVNNSGGLRGPDWHLQNSVYSPVMSVDPDKPGMTFAFDVFRHELLVPMDSPGIFYTWSVRSTAGGDINAAGWKDRNFAYYGGPTYVRSVNEVTDLIEPGATQVQVALGAHEIGGWYGYGSPGSNGSPAPYFDNVSVKVYPTAGPRIAVTELRLANDGFPTRGVIDLADLGGNSVRFDMSADISAGSHLRNDPGDSICVDVTPRAGGALSTPVMHFTFARRNPLFDAYRTLPASPVTGNVTRAATGAVVANRYNFDLPDTGLLFPGDILHYYFAATDNVGGDIRTAYAPLDRGGFGNPTPMAYPGAFTVQCLPSLEDATGSQPRLLFWNDFGFRGGEDEWYGALRNLGLEKGVHYDAFTTHGPSSGVGNGLGGRATVSQIAGYTDMLYSAGDLSSSMLSNGDYSGDGDNDLALLNDWFALGGRDLFMTGDNLATSLSTSGAAGRAFLETRMGLTFIDSDIRDNIAGQCVPLVVKTAGNPVYATANKWLAYGGCFGINDFDTVIPRVGAVRLAQFTSTDGLSTPYPYAAATLMVNGTNRVVSLNHDLSFIVNPANVALPIPMRAIVLSNTLDYFGVFSSTGTSGVAPASPPPLAVASYPNPFNPSVTLRYTLARPGLVTMKVFDMRGALVRTLVDGHVDRLTGVVTWDGTDQEGGGVSSGLYFVETRTDAQVDVRKVTMLK